MCITEISPVRTSSTTTIVLDLASKAGITMKGVQLADSYLAQVKEHMGARGDLAGIYGAVRQEAGLEFEN